VRKVTRLERTIWGTQASTRQGGHRYISSSSVPFRDMHCLNATWRDSLAAQAFSSAILTSGTVMGLGEGRRICLLGTEMWVELAAPRCVRNASYFACGGFVSNFTMTSSDGDPID
jgi:hypothetical protein